jgi:hypothetical protein
MIAENVEGLASYTRTVDDKTDIMVEVARNRAVNAVSAIKLRLIARSVLERRLISSH